MVALVLFTHIAKGIERDVKSLQHEMRSMHSLKRDVEDLHAATSSTVRTVQADLQQLREDKQQLNAAPPGTMEAEFSDARTRPVIKKSFEAIPIPKDA
jgi:hypothetical protein